MKAFSIFVGIGLILLCLTVPSWAQDYLVLKGSKEKITGPVSISEDQNYVLCNGKKYKIPKPLCFEMNGVYYGNVSGDAYYPAVIHGKINIFSFSRMGETGRLQPHNPYSSRSITTAEYRVQQGEFGEITRLNGIKKLKEMMSDRPDLVEEMEAIPKMDGNPFRDYDKKRDEFQAYMIKVIEVVKKYNLPQIK